MYNMHNNQYLLSPLLLNTKIHLKRFLEAAGLENVPSEGVINLVFNGIEGKEVSLL